MNDLFIVFESKYGQAEKIAVFAGELARRRGLDARVVRVDVARGVEVDAYAAIVAVAPIYFGRHPPALESYLRHHANVLRSRPFAFVSVSNSAASADPLVRGRAVGVARSFVHDLGVKPSATLTAGGALTYRRYNPLLRFVMKQIARRTGAPTDTSRSHELTDFVAFEEAFTAFLEGLEPRSTADFERPSRVPSMTTASDVVSRESPPTVGHS